MADVLVLDERAVEELLDMETCVELMAEALAALERGELHQPLRLMTSPPGASTLFAQMPSYRGGPEPLFGLKAICVAPGNPARGLDAHQGAVLLFDGETGRVRLIANASPITAIRTAAVSGVATRLLARPDARELAIVGAGVQGRTHLAAMAAVRPLARARVASRTHAHAELLAEEARARYPFPVEAVASVEEAVRGADLVVTATTARTPVVARAWLAPGAHVNAVGSSRPDVRELDTDTVADAAFFVDRRESALAEAGELVIAAAERGLGADHVRAELGELLTGRASGRSSPDELTVFKSVGIAVEDLAAAAWLERRAREAGRGHLVSL